MNQPSVTESRGAHLRAIEKISLLLGVILVVVAIAGFALKIQLSLSYGVLLSLFNARAIRFFGDRLARLKSVGLLVVLFQLKLFFIGALIYLGLTLFSLDGIGLCVGLSILPLAIVVRAVQWGMSAPNSNGEVVSNG